MGLTDHFAEALSRHGDIGRAAAGLGQSKAWGQRQFKAIRDRLGPQAV